MGREVELAKLALSFGKSPELAQWRYEDRFATAKKGP
jgi:hypothetical protein